MMTRYARWRARTARHPGTRAYWVRWLWWDAKTVAKRDATHPERYAGSAPNGAAPGSAGNAGRGPDHGLLRSHDG